MCGRLTASTHCAWAEVKAVYITPQVLHRRFTQLGKQCPTLFLDTTQTMGCKPGVTYKLDYVSCSSVFWSNTLPCNFFAMPKPKNLSEYYSSLPEKTTPPNRPFWCGSNNTPRKWSKLGRLGLALSEVDLNVNLPHRATHNKSKDLLEYLDGKLLIHAHLTELFEQCPKLREKYLIAQALDPEEVDRTLWKTFVEDYKKVKCDDEKEFLEELNSAGSVIGPHGSLVRAASPWTNIC